MKNAITLTDNIINTNHCIQTNKYGPNPDISINLPATKCGVTFDFALTESIVIFKTRGNPYLPLTIYGKDVFKF